MRSFMRSGRQNPHTLWIDDQVKSLDHSDLQKVAKEIARLESDVWDSLGISSSLSVQRVIQDLINRKDVICGVAYDKPEDIYGPYVAYILGYAVDPNDALHATYIQNYEMITGQSYEELLDEIPSHKLMLMLSWTKQFSNLGNRENAKLAFSLLRYLKKNKMGVGGEFRETTSYPIIMRFVERGDFVLKLDEELPNYLGDGETYRIVVGYFK